MKLLIRAVNCLSFLRVFGNVLLLSCVFRTGIAVTSLHIVIPRICLAVQTLLSLLLPGHGRLRSHIQEVLDLPLIQQQAENGALDIGRLSKFIVSMMGSLCAPCRDADINKLMKITDTMTLDS